MINGTDSRLHDVQAFQRDIALDKLSPITFQQARRNVILTDDASLNQHTVKNTLKQTNTFMKNLDKISKMDIRDNKKDIKRKETKKSNKNFLSETLSSILKDEKSIKLKQREDTNRKNIFFSQNTFNVSNTATHKLRPKNKPRTSSERNSKLPLDTRLSSKIEDTLSENIGMQNMQIKIPQVDSFTPLEAAAVSCVLEECLDQLVTIEFMIPADVDPRWDETFKTIDERYGVPDEPRMIFREDMGLLPIVPTAAEKLQRERYYVYKVLEKVLRDIKDNRRFDSLLEEVNNIVKSQEGECNLEKSAQMWHSEAEQLRELRESDKKANEDDRTRTIKLAQESDAQVDHTMFLNSGKLGYAERWAKARLEQQELKLRLQKEDVLNELNDYSNKYNAEQVISSEVSNHLEADAKEKEEQLIAWTKKYNEEIVNRQQEIDDLRILIEEQRSDMEKMRALKKKREEFIDESKRLEEAKHREKLNKAATIIQSIWRGYMVRHQLEKYKSLQKKRKKLKKTKKRVPK